MKIASATLEMKSSHLAIEKHEVNERLRMWTGDQPGVEGAQRPLARPAPPPFPSVSISSLGQQKSAEALAIESAQESVDHDPMLVLLKAMLFRMFGIEIEVFDASELAPPNTNEIDNLQKTGETAAGANPVRPAGFGIEYDYHEVRSETEHLSFSTEGVVKTSDGKTISFSVSLEMSRSFTERTDISLRLGDAARKKDPLVINFSGHAAALSNQTFRIDLDRDGTLDEAHFVAQGSGFLVFDRNSNGQIDQASELFGPTSGDGFVELAALDSDGNGWIDEGDRDFGRLQVWSRDASGKDLLQNLKESNVGAVSLARLATPFSLKDSSNVLLGEVKSSGVYLSDDGKAGTVQQIDLTV